MAYCFGFHDWERDTTEGFQNSTLWNSKIKRKVIKPKWNDENKRYEFDGRTYRWFHMVWHCKKCHVQKTIEIHENKNGEHLETQKHLRKSKDGCNYSFAGIDAFNEFMSDTGWRVLGFIGFYLLTCFIVAAFAVALMGGL